MTAWSPLERAERDAAAGGRELDRVADEVVHHRAQLFRVGHHGGRLDVDLDVQSLRLRRKLVRPRHVASTSASLRGASAAAACSARW